MHGDHICAERMKRLKPLNNVDRHRPTRNRILGALTSSPNSGRLTFDERQRDLRALHPTYDSGEDPVSSYIPHIAYFANS